MTDESEIGSTRNAVSVGAASSAPALIQDPSDRAVAMFAAAMTSSHPYALAVKYRNQKTAGSFAIASRLASSCRFIVARAQIAKDYLENPEPKHEPWMPALSEGLTPEVQAKRTAAIQSIEGRCQPVLDDGDLETPLSDDPLGEAARKLIDIQFNGARTPEQINQMAKGFAAQGLLWEAAGYMTSKDGLFGYFDGRPLGGLSQGEFRRAMWLSEMLVTNSGSRGAEDLRLLEACAYSARCDGDLEQVVFGGAAMDAEAVARIKALAEQMAVALRAGDVERFRRKP